MTVRESIVSARSGGDRDEGVVAVVGIGLVVPGASGPNEFWDLVQKGEHVFGEPGDRWPRVTNFLSSDPDEDDRTYTCCGGFVRDPGLHPAAAEAGGDVEARWLRHSVAQAYETVATSPRDRVAAYVGITVDTNQALEESMVVDVAARRIAGHWPGVAGRKNVLESVREQLSNCYPRASPDLAAHVPERILRAAVAGIVPDESLVVGVDTACSSSLYAVDLGTRALLARDIDIAVCGGVENLTVRNAVEFSKLHGLSRRGHVRSLGNDADGTLFSEGAATVVLKRLAQARRDGDTVLAVLGGFGAASDGRGKAIFTPNVGGQKRALRRACEAGGISADDIDWCVAHATGTPMGDGVEVEALNDSFTTRGHLCTSIKSVVGHAGWAAGTISLIYGILGLRNQAVPPQASIATLRPELENARLSVPRETVPFPSRAARPRTVGVAAFGFGGTNAYQILRDEDGPERTVGHARPVRGDGIVLVAWSAHLPGSPSSTALLDRARSGLPLAEKSSFGTAHPALPTEATRLTPITLRTIDRTQLMALAVAHRFAGEHGPLWERVAETTGVFAAHTGLTGVIGEVTMRSYRHDLAELPAARGGLEPDHWRKAVTGGIAALCADQPATNEDTLPGHMPNVIPARIASHLDLHGPAIALDAGTSSTQVAVYAAAQYLSAGDVDLALVLALNGATTPQAAAVAGVPQERLAEGAFLFALARASDAARNGWPIVGAVSTDARPRSRRPVPSRARTYLAADGATDLIAALARNEPSTLTGHGGAPAVTITPRTADPARSAVPVTTRHVTVWERQQVSSQVTRRPLPPACAVLTDEATASLLDTTVPVVTVGPDDDPGVAVDRLPGTVRHLRVVVGQGDPADWPTTTPQTIMHLHEALFLATQRFHRDLRDGGSIGVALLDEFVAETPAPHNGLFTGFVKSLAWEFRQCASRAVITDAGPGDAWWQLEEEIKQQGGLPVTVYRDGVRYRQRLVPAAGRRQDLPLRPGSVVVAVGGARGITAATVEGLLRSGSPTVWLIGSSRLDEVPPELLDARDQDIPRHRAAHIARGLEQGGPASVAELNRGFDRLVRARESCLTLARLRASHGDAAVRYLTADVTDGDAVHRAADAIAAEHGGGVDLLINGVGLHHPGDIERKPLETFQRVRDVKVNGYHNLKRSFPDVRLWCNFGSVTGLVGHPGESDYSSANDFLAHSAQYEKSVRGHDEYTVAWAIWREVGLAADELSQGFLGRAQHSSDMSKDEGVAHFFGELVRQPPRDALVTFIGEQDHESAASLFPGYEIGEPGRSPGYFLGEPAVESGDQATWRLVIDPAVERYLADHRVDGVPTLPGTMLTAVAAEAARHFSPHAALRRFRDLAFHAWVRGQKARQYTVTAVRTLGSRDETSVLVRVTSAVTLPDGRLIKEREHFRATVDTGPPSPDRVPTATWWDDDGTVPVVDPYYQADSRVHLTGPFQATRDWRTHSFGAVALWRPNVNALPDVFKRLPIPSLLLDSLARCKGLHVEDGIQELIIPRYIRRIEVFRDTDDVRLANEFPAGIQLHWIRPAGTWCAVAPGGSLIARIEDMRTIPFGHVARSEP
ncbi:hypothetical protein GCM10022254_23800 [Actinomadura meridiana]|uniref:Polyketide synthase n=1 Tax=Actinomadura meridiana TaxID=559626 RepID=A0ABP8BYD7_9ACTN